MAQHQIVCTERLESHEHITHVGTGPDAATQRWTVAEVRNAIEDGNAFYTTSPSTKRTAEVEPYDVHVNGRLVKTIRSKPDAIRDNNLDYLRVCQFKS